MTFHSLPPEVPKIITEAQTSMQKNVQHPENTLNSTTITKTNALSVCLTFAKNDHYGCI